MCDKLRCDQRGCVPWFRVRILCPAKCIFHWRISTGLALETADIKQLIRRCISALNEQCLATWFRPAFGAVITSAQEAINLVQEMPLSPNQGTSGRSVWCSSSEAIALRLPKGLRLG